DWTNPLSLALEQILNGKTVILITDEKRKWFEIYILCSINAMNLDRPLLPIVSMDSLYPHYKSVSGGEMIDVVEDMISLSYKDDYFFWYIGKVDDKRSDIAKRKDNSYFWIFDEEYHNGFTLKSYDPMIDIKLLQLYKLFDASLNATIFGEVDVKS
ncbi:MAG: hypothetical protein GQ474_04600, partial [Sulfurimonas sp.]|nr:hypothetical protein [Sulfurimonas sp.]